MDTKNFTINWLCLFFIMIISLNCSEVYSAEKLPPGTVLPEFKLKGPDSPQTKAYLGLDNAKQISLSKVKAKFVLVEFIDVF
jgi:hypothetical protein